MIEGIARIVSVLWLLLKAGLLIIGLIFVISMLIELLKYLKEM